LHDGADAIDHGREGIGFRPELAAPGLPVSMAAAMVDRSALGAFWSDESRPALAKFRF
jgi:hypothetical protein